MIQELPYVQAEFRKYRGIRDQIANICCIIEKAREFQKKSTTASLITLNPLWIKEMGIPNHLNCLLRNLYAGQEATVRTRHGAMNWFQTGKGVRQGCILSL